MADPRKIPTGRLSRLAKMTGLSTRVSSSYVVEKVKGVFQDEEERARSRLRAHIKNAERMVDTMGHMKGALMKVGQMLSLGDDDHVPREFTDILTRLQADAPTLPFERVYDEIVAALKVQPDQIFERIDAEPLAAASLAQVHRARLKTGQDVVVKVQYPGIGDTVESDLDNLKAMIKSSGVVGKRFNLDASFDEVKGMLLQELDYAQEADHLDFFREAFAHRDDVVVPRLYREYCTPKLLVMEYVEGLSFDDWLAQGPSQDEKDALAIRVMDLFFESFFKLRRIHADPQLGNFRFREDGTVVMLDFGCVREFPEPFVDAYVEAIKAGYHPLQRQRLINVLHRLGFLDTPEDGPLADYLLRHAELTVRAFAKDEPATFVGTDYPKEIKRLAIDPVVLKGLRFPPEIIYLNRVNIANYFLMRRLGVKTNFHRLLLRYVPKDR